MLSYFIQTDVLRASKVLINKSVLQLGRMPVNEWDLGDQGEMHCLCCGLMWI